MPSTDRINALLDRLPRTRVGRAHRPAPAFRTCGIAGFYLALIALFGGGLLTGRSPVVLAALALVSGWSFFVYTYLRKWITGREELVLLEHVWFALACNAATLQALQEPILGHLDVVAVALCPFLAAGRVGCTLVGCCHGLPSSFGIRYTEECAADGFPRHLVGIRLFPAPALEGIGLALIGVTGLAALPFAPPGKVLLWFLLAYAVMRFGLEGIRGDRRPHFLGLSQARWMAVAEIFFALHVGAPGLSVTMLVIEGALAMTLLGGLLHRWQRDPRRRFLAPKHVEELVRWMHECSTAVRQAASPAPRLGTTSCGATIVASPLPSPHGAIVHVSLALPVETSDLALLCELAVRAFPSLDPASAVLSDGRVLQVVLSLPLPECGLASASADSRARQLHASLIRAHDAPPGVCPPAQVIPRQTPSSMEVDGSRATSPVASVPWYMNPRRTDVPN